MIKIISTFCYLFRKQKYWSYFNVLSGELYPYRIKNKKEFFVYLYFDRLTGKPRIEYEEEDDT